MQLAVPIFLLLMGWGFGRIAERRHYASIHQREEASLNVPLTNERRLYPSQREVIETRLMFGSVVVSVDHFKRFLAWFKGLFGGEIHAYGSLLDRARREAKLRMIESWPRADYLLNFRFETSTISNSAGTSWGTVEVLAYATGIRFADSDANLLFQSAPATSPEVDS
ncbi:MAG: heavy metal-binding domain-containing protein [Planctomycetes bacterium]|nr:heavy metal-binding domain-containing protein [Planctomycetota bacterium]